VSSVLSVEGLVIGVSDLDAHRRLFHRGFGLEVLADTALSVDEVEALYGLRGHSGRLVQLATAGTDIGVQLVVLDPGSERVIRGAARGIDVEALKVIDFMTQDFDGAVRRLEEAGFPLASEPARYEVAGVGRFTEGHVDGPDGVKCAILQQHDPGWKRFATVTDRLFSEIIGFSSPIVDPEPVHSFFEVMGLAEVFRYDFESETFSAMIGLDRPTHVVGVNYGLSPKEPMIGTIHYGLPEDSYRSLAEHAWLPHRGLAGVRLRVETTADLAEACRNAGYEIVSGPSSVRLGPWGDLRVLNVRGPHGIVHHCVQQEE